MSLFVYCPYRVFIPNAGSFKLDVLPYLSTQHTVDEDLEHEIGLVWRLAWCKKVYIFRKVPLRTLISHMERMVWW